MLCCGTENEKKAAGMANDSTRSDDWMPSVLKSAKPAAAEKNKHWDVVLCAPLLEVTAAQRAKLSSMEIAQKEEEFSSKIAARKVTLSKLKAVGLHVHTFVHQPEDKDDPAMQYILVGATEDLLQQSAIELGIEKRLKPTGSDGDRSVVYAEYNKAQHDLFEKDPYGVNGAFFTSLDRIRCTFFLIESAEYLGCASVDLDRLVADGVFVNYFCMSDKRRLEDLKKIWIYGSWFKDPPVEMIRDYLGEKIAMYFAWVNLYTTWLLTLSVLSLVPFIYSYIYQSPTDTPYDNWAMPVYGLLSMIWAQMFLEAWKRYQAMLAYRWNVEDFEDEEDTRPEYRAAVLDYKREWDGRHPRGSTVDLWQRLTDPKKGDLKLGRWSEVGFVAIDPSDKELAANLKAVEWFNPSVRRSRLVITTLVGIFLFAFMMFVAILLQAMKAYIAHEGGPLYSNLSTILAAILQSIFIMVMSFLWSKIGVAINDWEMHRTDTDWEDALILKTFAFQFINCYGAAFYIAFIQGAGWTLPGIRVHDADNNLVPLVDHCLEGKCYKAIYLAMAIIILSKQISRQVLALGPILWEALMQLLKRGETKERIGLHSSVVRQAGLARFQGIHMEYLEMVLQFGYVAIFAVAFPIGSVICWVNNILEKRSDALKVVMLMQRPRYLGAQDIGSVMTGLELLALISVFTNCGILYLSSEAYYAYFPVTWGERPNFKVFVITVIVEHMVLISKQVLSNFVPDTPSWVLAEKARGKMKLDALKLASLSDDKKKRAASVIEKQKSMFWDDKARDEDAEY